MGGCCSSGRARSERVPVYLYCPPVLEHERFSSTHNTVSGLTSGILVDTNLDLSSPDTYRAPPAPLPYDMGIVRPQALPVNSEVDMGKNAPVTSMDTHPPERTFSDDRVEDSVQCKGLKHSNDSGNFEATKIDDCKSTKWNGPVDFEEEDCPICLEEYNMENPKMITKCGHHFHLCCMLEWMERSDVCPMCDQVVTFKYAFNK